MTSTQSEENAVVEVSKSDLPMHCPTPDAPLWNSHPKVFIPLEDSGESACPYCGTRFKLIEQTN